MVKLPAAVLTARDFRFGMIRGQNQVDQALRPIALE